MTARAVRDRSGPTATDGVSRAVRTDKEAQPSKAEVGPGSSLQAHPPPWNLLGKEGRQLGAEPTSRNRMNQLQPPPARQGRRRYGSWPLLSSFPPSFPAAGSGGLRGLQMRPLASYTHTFGPRPSSWSQAIGKSAFPEPTA